MTGFAIGLFIGKSIKKAIILGLIFAFLGPLIVLFFLLLVALFSLVFGIAGVALLLMLLLVFARIYMKLKKK